MEITRTIWGRIVARLRGEVTTDTLEAYRRAGTGIHEALDALEGKRLDAKIKGQSAWDLPNATQIQVLCTWNAYALQSLGNAFLDADYAYDPVTIGFVPQITADQAMDYYSQVEPWLSRARQAEQNSAYRLDMKIPHSLPAWREVEPCPRAHLDAMLAAVTALELHIEHALHVFEGQGTPADKQDQAQKIYQLHADARTKAEYAQNMMQERVSQDLHERIEVHAQGAIERYFLLGQYLSMPSLIKPVALSNTSEYLGDNGFDRWCMTDPVTKEELKRDPQAVKAIDLMWQFDPNHQKTLKLQAQLDLLLRERQIDYAKRKNGELFGRFMCTPYAPIYVAQKNLEILGERILKGQQFTLEVSCEGVNLGEEFTREVVVGPFGTVPDLDYCDPNVKEDH
jgi:hypothetical protein